MRFREVPDLPNVTWPGGDRAKLKTVSDSGTLSLQQCYPDFDLVLGTTERKCGQTQIAFLIYPDILCSPLTAKLWFWQLEIGLGLPLYPKNSSVQLLTLPGNMMPFSYWDLLSLLSSVPGPWITSLKLTPFSEILSQNGQNDSCWWLFLKSW